MNISYNQKFEIHIRDAGKIDNFFDNNKTTKKLIQWDDKLFQTKHNEVDQSHCEIIRLINNIYYIIKTNERPPSYIKKMIIELKDYIECHFRKEEELMLKNNYPFFNLHKNHHDQFREIVDDLLKSYYNEIINIKQVFAFLMDWLVSHVTKIDKQMSEEIHLALIRYE
jgi:hemerythrin-like metal-binding protein